ncbi:MAG: molybdopterin-dependent oxidoreductase [Candidatus Sericytochromatia bacterium]|nr:molybdopterin-dependent oxidoreductase [Candidatus Tanganyikabacteria bacterium]
MAGPEPDLAVVGKPLPKVDVWDKVTGQARYAGDLSLPRMAYGKLRRADRPHARIRRIDTAAARALPGVYAVITAADLPAVKYGILPVSQDEEALKRDHVRMVGDPIAAVAAVDEATAEAACDLIAVEYEALPAVLSIQEALAEGGVRLHEYGEGPGNVHKAVALSFGDVDAAFAGAAHVREDVFFYAGNAHMPLETHACLAQCAPDGKLTLWSSTQTPHYVHRALAMALEMPAAHVRVIAPPIGGGFGGKTDPFAHEIVACRLAQLTGRPVKIELTREEVFYCHRGRHPALMWVRTGVTREGDLLGMHFKVFLDGGSYGSYGVASLFYTGALQTVTYRLPAYRFEGVRVFTNKPPCGPKRGHGTPQPRFALECHLDKIACDLGLDPAAMRRRILAEPYRKTANHLTVTTMGLGECLDRVVAASGWKERRGNLPPGRGLGIACSSYLTGAGLPIYWNDMPHSGAIVKIDRGGGVAILCGATDIGQGSSSVLAYLVAERLGIAPLDINVYTADTDLTPVDLGSYSSRVTLMAGNAVLAAADRLRGLLAAAAATKLGVAPDRLVFRDRRVHVAGDPAQGMDFARAAMLAEGLYGTLAAPGSYTPPRRGGKFKGAGVGPSPCYSYSACVAEVSVDEETGQVRVEDIWLAHDVGKALNPNLAVGQVEGSVYMGLGEALMEEFGFRECRLRAPSLLEYKSPTALDMPRIHTILVETGDPEGPYGAKEVGQGPLLPVMPAIANAVFAAVGVRIDETPITADKVLRGLALRLQGRPARVGPAGIPEFAFPEALEVPSGFGEPAEAPDRPAWASSGPAAGGRADSPAGDGQASSPAGDGAGDPGGARSMAVAPEGGKP